MTPIDARCLLRSEGMCDAVVEAVAACVRSPRRDALAALAQSFGFDGFSYIVVGASGAQPRVVDHWTSCGTSWTTRYAARGYHLVDPRVTLTRHRSIPVAWNASIGEREPRASQFLADAGRHDVRAGIAWSAFDARVGRAVVAFDCSRGDAVAVGRSLGTIALLAGIVHEALVAHCSNASPAGGSATLTGRERQCLALAARGMTSADAGIKLGITARTANFHIGNAMAKLGAVSRGEAIARAVAANLVSVED